MLTIDNSERYKEEIEKTKRAELAEKKASIFKDFLTKIQSIANRKSRVGFEMTGCINNINK